MPNWIVGIHVTTELLATWATGGTLFLGGVFGAIRFIRKPHDVRLDSVESDLSKEIDRSSKNDKEFFGALDAIREDLAFIRGKLNGRDR